jgi:hypothetical protein
MSGEVTVRREAIVQTERDEKRFSDHVEMRKAAPSKLHDPKSALKRHEFSD